MKTVVSFSVLMSCWVRFVVTFSVHVMLGDVVVNFSVYVMLGEVCGLPSLFISCWVKTVVSFSVHVMLGEDCGYLLCSCHAG